MNRQGRIDALAARHDALDAQLQTEDHRPAPDAAIVTKLKTEKLRLKDEIERLRAGADGR